MRVKREKPKEIVTATATELKKVIELEKLGWKVIEVKSASQGTPKTWFLRKEI